MAFHPFGAALPLGDGHIFLLELLGRLGERPLRLQKPRSRLAAKAEILLFGNNLRLLQAVFFGAATVLAAL